ncbi:MAG: hypothetical protein EP343_14610 [Deltaproteobacteria bacterium]|nr:MAG: hypothetical protein EP343_14610 [Deltaproteobacteria bacterium]
MIHLFGLNPGLRFVVCFACWFGAILLPTKPPQAASTRPTQKRLRSQASPLSLSPQDKKSIAKIKHKAALHLFLKKKFPNTATYRQSFLWGELLYAKARLSQGKASRVIGSTRRWFLLAAKQYQRVAKNKNKRYRKQAWFATMLCYEALLQGSSQAHLSLRNVARQGGKKHTTTLRIQGGSWTVTWRRIKIRPNSLTNKLLQTYNALLKSTSAKTQQNWVIQLHFKRGTLLYARKHYGKALNMFQALAQQHPSHELSRRGVFMILYMLEDLRLMGAMTLVARHYLDNPKLTAHKRFKLELYRMLIRSVYLYAMSGQQGEPVTNFKRAQRLENYEQAYGPHGKWVKTQGLKASPKAVHSLALAGFYYKRANKLDRTIRVWLRLIHKYPNHKLATNACFNLAKLYGQLAQHDKAARWYENYVFGIQNKGGWLRKPAKQLQKKRPKPTPRRNKRRRRTRYRRTVVQLAAARRAKRVRLALYSAATHRRAIKQWSRSIVLFRHYLQRVPRSSPKVKEVFLSMAKMYEKLGQQKKARLMYQKHRSIR